MAHSRRITDARRRAALAAFTGSRPGAARGAQCRVPRAAGRARRRERSRRDSLPPLLADAARRVGGACRRTRCGGCRRHRSACSMPGFATAPRWLELRARGVHDQQHRGEPHYFEHGCGALHHPTHAGLRLAPGAQPPARGVPGVRRHHRGRRIAGGCSLSALDAAAERNADALRPRWAHQLGLLARAAGGFVSRCRQATARVAARWHPAPCRRNPGGACPPGRTCIFALIGATSA